MNANEEGRYEVRGQSTSDLLEKVVADHQEKDTISVGDIKNSLHERGFGVLMAIAVLPVSVPFPTPPGYTTIFAVPLLLLSLQMIWGMNAPWLPRWIARRQVKRTTLAMLVRKGNPFLRKVEKLLRPRLTYLGAGYWEKLVGIFAFIFSLSVAIPIPLTHTLPAWGVLFMALGLLSKDGIMVILGIVTGTIGWMLTACVLYFGTEVAQKIVDKLTDDVGVNQIIPDMPDMGLGENPAAPQ